MDSGPGSSGMVCVYRPERVSPTLLKSPCSYAPACRAISQHALSLVLLGLGPLLLLPFLPCGRLLLLCMAFGLLALLAGYSTCGFILPLSSIFAL
jgi:hypothetical protein